MFPAHAPAERSTRESPPSAPYRARVFTSHVRPDARFTVVSDRLEYEPTVRVQEGEGFLAGLYWNDYGTRIVRYGTAGPFVPFFPHLDAPVVRGETYRMGAIRSTEELADDVVTVGFGPTDGADTGDATGVPSAER